LVRECWFLAWAGLFVYFRGTGIGRFLSVYHWDRVWFRVIGRSGYSIVKCRISLASEFRTCIRYPNMAGIEITPWFCLLRQEEIHCYVIKSTVTERITAVGRTTS
jgi:hypothetical protein